MFQFLNALRCTAGNRYCCCCCFYYSCKMTVSIVQSDNRTIRHQRRETKPKRSKQNKKEKKTPNRSSPFICLFIVHAIVTMVLPQWTKCGFSLIFFCCCEEAVSYIIITFPLNKAVHWVFMCVFIIFSSAFRWCCFVGVLFPSMHAISKYNAIVCSALDAKIM